VHQVGSKLVEPNAKFYVPSANVPLDLSFYNPILLAMDLLLSVLSVESTQGPTVDYTNAHHAASPGTCHGFPVYTPVDVAASWIRTLPGHSEGWSKHVLLAFVVTNHDV